MTQDEQNDLEWSKQENWTLFYFSKKDSRWIVPKKVSVGWTYNLGQQKGAWALLLSIIAPFIVVIALQVITARSCSPCSTGSSSLEGGSK